MCKSKKIMQIEHKLLTKRAGELFDRMSGFSKNNPASEYQLEDKEVVHAKVVEKIEIQAMVKEVSSFSLEENFMMIDGKCIHYNLPLRDYSDRVKEIYIFLVSEKTVADDRQETIEQLYTHIWQNAYLDAAREWLKDWLKKESGWYVSDCISPGFYGIPIKCMSDLYDLVEGKNIGVHLREDGFLLPEKSVLGMYFTMKEDINIFGKRCLECPAHGKNCEYCLKRM